MNKNLWKFTKRDPRALVAFKEAELRQNEVLAELDVRGVKSINLIPKKENRVLVEEARALAKTLPILRANASGKKADAALAPVKVKQAPEIFLDNRQEQPEIVKPAKVKSATKILRVKKIEPHVHIFPEGGSETPYLSREMNPLDILAYYAKLSPDAIAIVNEKRSITFSQLYIIVRQFAIKFNAAGIQPGDLVVTRLPSTLDWIATLALMSQGAITCSRSGRTPIDPSLNPKFLVSDGSFIWQSNNTLILNDAWIADAEKNDPTELPNLALDNDLPCRIIFTNGTIGAAKAVEFSLKLLNARTDQYNRTWLKEKSVMPLLDLSATLGFFTFFSLFLRGEKIVTSSQLNFDTVRVALNEEVEVFVASPLRAVQLLEILKRTETKMPKLKKVVISGNVPTLKLLNNVASSLNVEVINIYGSTECGDVSFLQTTADAKPSDMGWVYPEARVQIVDSTGDIVENGVEGRIGTSSATMVHRYFRTNEPNRKVFVEGWFYSGDFGYLTVDGRLILTGRDTELIDIGKMKVNPQIIEELVLDYAGVLDCGAFTYKDAAGAHVLSVAIVGDKDLNLKLMTSAIARELGEMSPQTYFVTDRIPRDTLGKVLRSELTKSIKAKMASQRNGKGGKS